MNSVCNRTSVETLEIVKLGGEILRQKAVPVTVFGQRLEETVARMIEALDKAQGVGLAAPQVGIGERFFVVQIKGEVPIVFVNPSIIETSPETVACEEGCLSLPGSYADVVRPSAVKVQAFDTKGRPFTLECAGLLARVVQHENDHLDGILFYDHLSELKQKRLLEKYEKIAKHKPGRKHR
ncbi:MAG: peptide deformylase [Spirochaetaceae bacterium]|jgi:peptide deformylase|nr:peptide deformylase [Spirochaetaceae bacterium]